MAYTCGVIMSLLQQMVLLAQGPAGPGASDEPNAALLFWAAVLGAAAVVIIAIELIVPSGGLLALAAGACVVASIVACFMHSTAAGLLSLGVYFILGPIAGWFVFRWWLESPLGRRFVLSAEVARVAPENESGEAARDTPGSYNEDLRALIGIEGEAVTPLRPVGTVRIMDERFDALAEAGSIAAGARIIVTDVYDNQVKVREVDG